MDEKIIELDTREQDSEFIYLIDSKCNEKKYTLHLTALPIGDIKYKNIIIERKEINDYCSSVILDRMFNQVFQAKQNPEYSFIIIISGTKKDLWKDNLDKISCMIGAEKQIIAWGIPVIHVDNDNELIEKAFELFKYSKPIDIPVKKIDKDNKLSMFLALPKIGRKNAQKLINDFGTIEMLVNATEDEIINSVGNSKGKLIYNALRK